MSTSRLSLDLPVSSVTARRVRSARKGFTLIELLTVIGVLAAILIPTVGAVRKRATKATCASNLRQLGYAVILSKNDNRGLIPDGNVGSPQVQWISTDLRDEFIRYGMTFPMFFCNGNTAYRDQHMTEANRTAKGSNIPMGYLYLPGTTAKTLSGNDSNYKELREGKINYRLIAADVNRKWKGDFAGGINHSDEANPIGANHLYIDGAVRWYAADTFIAQAALTVNTGGQTDYYFKTEDTK